MDMIFLWKDLEAHRKLYRSFGSSHPTRLSLQDQDKYSSVFMKCGFRRRWRKERSVYLPKHQKDQIPASPSSVDISSVPLCFSIASLVCLCLTMATVDAAFAPRPPSRDVIAFAISVVHSKPPDLSVGGKYPHPLVHSSPLTSYRIHPTAQTTCRQRKQSKCRQLDLPAS